MRHFWGFLTSGVFDLWPFELKIGTSVIPSPGSARTNFGFSMAFRFRFINCVRNGRTDRRTSKTRNVVY